MRIITSEVIERGAFLQANKVQFRMAMSTFEERFTGALYLEFTSNAVGYSTNNPEMFKDLYGMKDCEYEKAFNELIDKGYLVPQAKDICNMYREPQLKTKKVVSPAVSKVPAQVYCLKLTGNGETFYKVGVTKTSIEDRFRHLEAYDFEVVQQYWMPEPSAYEIESALHKLGEGFKYVPKISFGGDSECFSTLDFVQLEMTLGSVRII